MRNIKKLLSIAMVLAMVLSLGVSVLASGENRTVTVEGKAGTEFLVYRVFAGGTAMTTPEGETKEVPTIGEIDWGGGVNSAAFLNALRADRSDIFGTDCNTAEDVAKALSANMSYADRFAQLAYENRADSIATIKIEADKNEGSVSLPDGYYLIVEKDDSNKNGVINPALLQLTDNKDVHIKQKADVPTVDKAVKDMNDTTGGGGMWEDSADHDIGDKIEFKLTATIGAGYELYEAYYLLFTDEMSAGLTYQNNAVVHLGDENGTDITEAFTINAVSEGEGAAQTTLTVECANLKGVPALSGLKAGDTITVTYTAVLNDDAKIGVEGNPNTVTLTYSSDPNNNQYGNPPTDKTKPDTVIVFTFDQLVNKVDANGESLVGAGFTLLKKVLTGGTTVKFFEGTANEIVYDSVKEVGTYAVEDGRTTFDFDGLDDGEYILVESTVPEGYNKAEDILFKIEAEHKDPDDANGNKDGEALTVFKVFVWDKTAGESGAWIEQGVGGDKNQKVLGVEKRPVEGGSMINGVVVNDSGLELPETGGIGTTIFYVVGAILVVGAVILLVSRKRAGSAQK